ncbi:uncharacterized protein LOC144071100 isoform X2 [Stigmatopora argus]
MSFQRRWHSMHARYEHFEPMDAREVTVHQTTHRVVNYVERAGPIHSADNYEQGYDNDQWFPDEPIYPGNERPRNNDYPRDPFYDGNYPRNSHHQDPHYQQPQYDRDDLRHQIRTRKNGRPGPYPNNRGRGYFQNRVEHNKFRQLQNAKGEWERPSGKRKSVPPAKKNAPAESDKDPSRTQSEPVEDSTPAPNVPAEEPPKTSILAKETPSDSGPREKGVGEAEGETAAEVPAAAGAAAAAPPASGEPKRIQEEDLKARRSDAIQAKALEIEKDYQQDCETFVTVVKMLVSKEPTLENLLQSALNANLSEMKQQCLASFKQYVKELNKDHKM